MTPMLIPGMRLWQHCWPPLSPSAPGSVLNTTFHSSTPWGIVPTYLNELSPDDMRGTLPGFAYQLGNLLAASTATAQSWLADRSGGNYALVLALWMAGVAIVLALLAWLGPEVRGARFGQAAPARIAGLQTSRDA